MFCGTSEFTSLGAHKGYGHSRRDDLESIGLNLIFYINGGALPWYNKYEGETKHKKIMKLMEATTIEDLCTNCPKPIIEFMKYCRGIMF